MKKNNNLPIVILNSNAPLSNIQKNVYYIVFNVIVDVEDKLKRNKARNFKIIHV